jgi:DNA-directed RNA polymerase specialized sigma subunit
VKELLSLYPDMAAMSQTIQTQMRNVLRTSDKIDDAIESLALRHSTIEDMNSYSEGSITDKTCKTAIGYQSALNNEKKEALRELRGELLSLRIVVDKIDIALKVLPALQKDILTARYWERLVWSEITDRFMISASSAKQKRDVALDRLCKLVRVSIDEYEKVKRLFD